MRVAGVGATERELHVREVGAADRELCVSLRGVKVRAVHKTLYIPSLLPYLPLVCRKNWTSSVVERLCVFGRSVWLLKKIIA